MSIQETNLKAIADAIRAKTGETGMIQASKFAEKIGEIKGGADIGLIALLKSNIRVEGIAYGNGIFIATMSINNTNQLISCKPGDIEWTLVTVPVSGWWGYVCYGRGKFVAFQYTNAKTNIAMYSVDGINWSQMSLPITANFTTVKYVNGIFMAGGWKDNAAVLIYSADGVNWTNITLPAELKVIFDIAYGNGKYVLIDNTYGQARAAHSADGINWTTFMLTSSLSSRSLSGIVYGNGKFVISVEGSGYVQPFYSTDGITWSRSTFMSLQNESNVRIAYGDGVFVMTMYNNRVACSLDGNNWVFKSPLNLKYANNGYNSGILNPISVAYGDGMFIIGSNTYTSCFAKASWFKNQLS